MIFQSYKVITQAYRGSQKWKSHSIMLFKGPCWHKQTMQWCEGPVLTKAEGFISSVPQPSSDIGSWAQCARMCSPVQEHYSPRGASAPEGPPPQPPLSFLSFFPFLFFLPSFLSLSCSLFLSKQLRQLHTSQSKHFSTPIIGHLLVHHGHEEDGDSLHSLVSHAEQCPDTNSLRLVRWGKVYFHAKYILYIHSRVHNQQNMKLYYGLWC